MGPKDIYDWPAIPWLVVTWRHCHSKLLIDDHDKIKAEWKPEFFEKSKHIQDSVLATLALTKFGAVGLGGHLTQLCNWELGSFSTMAFLTSETRVSQFSSLPGRYLELTSKDCIDLQEIFPLVLETNPITIALKRLSS
jgi:hypothetical protein